MPLCRAGSCGLVHPAARAAVLPAGAPRCRLHMPGWFPLPVPTYTCPRAAGSARLVGSITAFAVGSRLPPPAPAAHTALYATFTYHIFSCCYTRLFYRSAVWFILFAVRLGLLVVTGLRYRCTRLRCVTQFARSPCVAVVSATLVGCRLRAYAHTFTVAHILYYGSHAVTDTRFTTRVWTLRLHVCCPRALPRLVATLRLYPVLVTFAFPIRFDPAGAPFDSSAGSPSLPARLCGLVSVGFSSSPRFTHLRLRYTPAPDGSRCALGFPVCPVGWVCPLPVHRFTGRCPVTSHARYGLRGLPVTGTRSLLLRTFPFATCLYATFYFTFRFRFVRWFTALLFS